MINLLTHSTPDFRRQHPIKELVEYNMHCGTGSVWADVGQLLCFLAKDNMLRVVSAGNIDEIFRQL
jgi:hypothetical protein